MKLPITITYTDGQSVTYVAGLPEWSKWERKTGKSLYSATTEKIAAEGIGAVYQQGDFLFLAHAAYVRQSAGKPVKPYDIWELTVEEIAIGEPESPKGGEPEALTK